MPKNILISFVGTGPAVHGTDYNQREYRKAKYSFQDQEYESSFVSSVLYDALAIDDIIMVGTVRSMWEEVYRYFSIKNGVEVNEDYQMSLYETSSSSNYKSPLSSIDLEPLNTVLTNNSKAIVTPYGLDEAEQLTIFESIADALTNIENGDTIYLDITHSFRSLPLFTNSVLMYLKEVLKKDFKLGGVYYGMLDVIKEFNGVAPIVDVSSTLKLQEWTKAAYTFQEYGKGYLLADLIGGKDADILRVFSNATSINYLKDIETKLINFKQLAEKEHSPYAKLILPSVLGEFSKDLLKAKEKGQSNFQLKLANWYLKQKNYSSAYIVFVEAIVTFVCEEKSLPWDKFEGREEAKRLIRETNVFELQKLHYEVNNVRNKIAHNLNKKSRFNITKDIELLEKSMSTFERESKMIQHYNFY